MIQTTAAHLKVLMPAFLVCMKWFLIHLSRYSASNALECCFVLCAAEIVKSVQLLDMLPL